MLRKNYLLAYDIAENKLRKSIYELLLDLCMVPIQKSVFWGELTKPEALTIQRKMREVCVSKKYVKVVFISFGSISQEWLLNIGHDEEVFEIKESRVI